MADYTHGAYGVLKDSVVANVDEAATAVVAIGTLPVHLLPSCTGLVGVPLAAENATAKGLYGYSDDWGKFTLCEVEHAFLGNPTGNIGGLYLINVLDPATHKAVSDTEVSVTFANGVGTITDELAILSTVAVDGITGATAEYNPSTGVTTIRATGATGAKTVTYRRVDPTAVTAAQVAEAAAAIDDIFPTTGIVPDIIIAPGFSDDPAVYGALVAKAQSINGHFLGFVLADIPTTEDTVAEAIAWKASNNYVSKYSKACWPCVNDSSGRVFHISTLFAREMVRNDALNDGVPYVTASNTAVAGASVCLADGTPVKVYQEQGNSLNAYGISTVIAWNGELRLWGGHTANYIHSSTHMEAGAVFDTNIRMLCYLVNSFQIRWIGEIDQPMTLALQEAILFAEQERLDGLVAQGALIGAPAVSFLPTSNPDSDIVQGEFTWDINATPTPQLKTARVVVAYTTDGFSAYIASGSGSEEE